MEGFLFVFNKKKYTRYWCVLEGQHLSQYAEFDVKSQEASGFKGVLEIKNAAINKLEFSGKANSLSILCEGKKAHVYVDCGKSRYQDDWYGALLRASKSHEAQNKRTALAKESAAVLGISPDAVITPRLVSSTYRKLCLKAHPDKGGDVNKFNEIRLAYTKLSAYAIEEDAKASCPEVEYEAVIKKTPAVGLGIVVIEDAARGRIVVQAVQDAMVLEGISEESEGEIRTGDTLYAIDKDVCSSWPMSRIKARLNNFRVPVNSTVRMTFARRVPQEEADVSTPLSPMSSTGNFSDFSSPTNEKKRDVKKEVVAPRGIEKCDASQQAHNVDVNSVPTTNCVEKLSSEAVKIDNSDSANIDTEKVEVKENESLKTANISPIKLEEGEQTDVHIPDDKSVGDEKENCKASASDDDSWQSSKFDDEAEEKMENGNEDVIDKGDDAKSDPEQTLSNVDGRVDIKDMMRELADTKSELKAYKLREASLREANAGLSKDLADTNAQVRVLEADLRTTKEDLSKACGDLDELKERCNALSTLLEDRITDLKSNSFTSASGINLENLMNSSNDAIQYKRDLNIAYNSLAAVRLSLQAVRKDSAVVDSPSVDDNVISAPPKTDFYHAQHSAHLAETTDAIAANLKKQLLAVLDI